MDANTTSALLLPCFTLVVVCTLGRALLAPLLPTWSAPPPPHAVLGAFSATGLLVLAGMVSRLKFLATPTLVLVAASAMNPWWEWVLAGTRAEGWFRLAAGMINEEEPSARQSSRHKGPHSARATLLTATDCNHLASQVLQHPQGRRVVGSAMLESWSRCCSCGR